MTSNAGAARHSSGLSLALSLIAAPLLVLGIATLLDGPASRGSESRSVDRSVDNGEVRDEEAADAPREALRAWDRRRVAAWISHDTEALRRLYVPGSVAGDRDVAMLRRWVDRGLRVKEMQMQVSATRVIDAGPARMRIQVTDRLAHAVAVGAGLPGGSVTLPGDRESTRLITLRRAPDGPWRVAAVLPVV